MNYLLLEHFLCVLSFNDLHYLEIFLHLINITAQLTTTNNYNPVLVYSNPVQPGVSEKL